MSRKLRRIADENGIAHKVDLFKYYVSDGMAFWRDGGDAVVGTACWAVAYLLDEG